METYILIKGTFLLVKINIFGITIILTLMKQHTQKIKLFIQITIINPLSL